MERGTAGREDGDSRISPIWFLSSFFPSWCETSTVRLACSAVSSLYFTHRMTFPSSTHPRSCASNSRMWTAFLGKGPRGSMKYWLRQRGNMFSPGLWCDEWSLSFLKKWPIVEETSSSISLCRVCACVGLAWLKWVGLECQLRRRVLPLMKSFHRLFCSCVLFFAPWVLKRAMWWWWWCILAMSWCWAFYSTLPHCLNLLQEHDIMAILSKHWNTHEASFFHVVMNRGNLHKNSCCLEVAVFSHLINSHCMRHAMMFNCFTVYGPTQFDWCLIDMLFSLNWMFGRYNLSPHNGYLI